LISASAVQTPKELPLPPSPPPQTETFPQTEDLPVNIFDTETSTLQEEIDALRTHMHWLQESIAAVESVDQRLKLGRAYQESGYCLSRLLRTQHLLEARRDTEWEKSVNKAINHVLVEWGWK
jgi:hypothetical protein